MPPVFLYQPPEGEIADGARSRRRGGQSTVNEPTSRALVISEFSFGPLLVWWHRSAMPIRHGRTASTSPPVPLHPELFLYSGSGSFHLGRVKSSQVSNPHKSKSSQSSSSKNFKCACGVLWCCSSGFSASGWADIRIIPLSFSV